MNDKNFLESIDDETLAKLIDTTLRFEQNKKTGKPGFNALKAVPAAAAVLLIAGIITLINILPVFVNPDNPGSEMHHAGSNAKNIYTTAAATEPEEPAEPAALFVPPIVEKTFFEEKILAGITNQRDRDKMLAYYVFIDLTAPEEPDYSDYPGYGEEWWESYLNEKLAQAAETIALYPICETVPVYILDPNASDRELFYLLGNLKTYTALSGDDLIGMYEANGIPYEDLPMFTGENYTQDSDFGEDARPAAEAPAEPEYGIQTAADGTEYIEFKNKSLYAALLEYFKLDRWFDYITPAMLSQIYSIEVKVRPEYNYIYDNKGLREDFGLDCKYIEYTINGKTLDILPERFIEGGVLEGHMEQASLDIYKYFDYENGYYITKPDLTIEDKLLIYDVLAWGGAVRTPVERAEDGSYYYTTFFNTSQSMYVLGFLARYYDLPAYDSADIIYMPNLAEFKVEGMPGIQIP